VYFRNGKVLGLKETSASFQEAVLGVNGAAFQLTRAVVYVCGRRDLATSQPFRQRAPRLYVEVKNRVGIRKVGIMKRR
jgi:hypothetical protein